MVTEIFQKEFLNCTFYIPYTHLTTVNLCYLELHGTV